LVNDLAKRFAGLNLFSHPVFQHKPWLLKRVQVWGVRREIQAVATRWWYQRFHASALVEGGMVTAAHTVWCQHG
jgi:hypothetical protein